MKTEQQDRDSGGQNGKEGRPGRWRRLFSVDVSNCIPAEAASDPLSGRTQWEPLKKSGANFRTRELVISPDGWLASFEQTRIMKIFRWLVPVGGGLFGSFYLLDMLSGEWPPPLEEWIPLVIAGVMVVAGLLFAWFGSTPICFDKQSGFHWKGRIRPDRPFKPDRGSNVFRLESIGAVQLLRKWVQSQQHSFICYELNLVLDDGSRLHLFSHGNLAAMREDAGKLARFLGRPFWDATP